MSIETQSDSDEEAKSKWPRYHAVCRDCRWSLLLTADSKMIDSVTKRHREQHNHRTAYERIDSAYVDDDQQQLDGS